MNVTKYFLDYRFKSLKKALSQPEKHQKKALSEVVNCFQNTMYSSELGIQKSISTDEYLASVPVCRYGDISPFIEMMKKGKQNVLVRDRIKYFGESSGTTGRNKTIPLSKRYVYDCLIKGSLYTGAIVNHFIREASHGKMVVLPGSLKKVGDCLVGDVSAIMAEHIPLFMRQKSAYNSFSNVNRSWSDNLKAIVSAIQKIKTLSA